MARGGTTLLQFWRSWAGRARSERKLDPAEEALVRSLLRLLQLEHALEVALRFEEAHRRGEPLGRAAVQSLRVERWLSLAGSRLRHPGWRADPPARSRPLPPRQRDWELRLLHGLLAEILWEDVHARLDPIFRLSLAGEEELPGSTEWVDQLLPLYRAELEARQLDSRTVDWTALKDALPRLAQGSRERGTRE